MRRVAILPMLFGLVLAGGCAATLKPLVGSPETNGMAVVLFEKMTWKQEKNWQADENHYLRVVACNLQPVLKGIPGEVSFDQGEAIHGVWTKFEQPSLDTDPLTSFVFSDLPPGHYRVVACEAVHGLSEGHPTWFRYSFPREEFPELALEVGVGGIEYVGEVFFKTKHVGHEESFVIRKGAEDTDLSVTKRQERNALQALIKRDPEGSWAPALRNRLAVIRDR